MSLARTLGRVLVTLLVTELTLRAVLLVDSVALKVVTHGWDEPARMLWADRRLKSWITRDPQLGWHEASPEEEWDAELGWTRSPGRVEADEHGCRDGGLPRAPDAHRIVLVGDSFTFGTDVKVTDSYGHLLEERRSDVDVHNVAMPAYDHLQATLRWERVGAPLRPEAVVLLAIDADIARSTFWFYGYGKPWPELDASGDVVVRGQPVDDPLTTLAKGLARPRLLDVVDVIAARRADPAPRTAEAERRAAAVLDRWAASVQAAGAVPIVLSLPIPNQVDGQGRLRDGQPGRAFYRRWCEGKAFPCVDARDAFVEGMGDPTPYVSNAHWGRAGNARVAALVERELVDAGVLPPAL